MKGCGKVRNNGFVTDYEMLCHTFYFSCECSFWRMFIFIRVCPVVRFLCCMTGLFQPYVAKVM